MTALMSTVFVAYLCLCAAGVLHVVRVLLREWRR